MLGSTWRSQTVCGLLSPAMLKGIALLIVSVCVVSSLAQVYVKVDWTNALTQSNTTATLQVVVNPLIMRGSPIHDAVFNGLAALKAEHVRFVPWFPYPTLVVAELNPPAGGIICDTVDVGVNMSLSCAAGTISSISFASFGTPNGRCGSFSIGKCSANDTLVKSVISQSCVGKSSCLVLNSLTETFKVPDPCPGQYEVLSVQAVCSQAPNTTSWDFTLIDPMMEDFLAATADGEPIINFSTIPQWMWQTDEPVAYSLNYTLPDWGYEQGNRLRDESRQDLANYYARLVSWYTRGGFTDEFGHTHTSGYSYNITHWEILNEVEAEHQMTPQYYTLIYDSMVSAIRQVVPKMKFVGMALSGHREWDWYTYFLNASNHAAGIPIDYISFHQYASCSSRTDPDGYSVFFDSADAFFEEVLEVQAIRKALSPKTKIDIDEIGVILPDDNVPDPVPFPDIYWNAAAAYYAYIFGNLALQNVDYLGESQLVGYPTQFPSVSMVNWTTGQMTARYWVLSLLITQFKARPFTIYNTLSSVPSDLFAMGSVDANGVRRVLIINKSNLSGQVQLEDVPANSVYWHVDSSNDWETPTTQPWPNSGQLSVLPYGVYIVVYQS